jgi:hypothetical protein
VVEGAADVGPDDSAIPEQGGGLRGGRVRPAPAGMRTATRSPGTTAAEFGRDHGPGGRDRPQRWAACRMHRQVQHRWRQVPNRWALVMREMIGSMGRCLCPDPGLRAVAVVALSLSRRTVGWLARRDRASVPDRIGPDRIGERSRLLL